MVVNILAPLMCHLIFTISKSIIAMKNLANQPLTQQILCQINDFTLEVCIDEKSLNTAFHLRYKAYFHAGFTPEKKDQQISDQYDQAANSRTFLVWYQGKPVATVRSCVYSSVYHWEQTEVKSYFSADVNREMGEKSCFLESGRFAVDPQFQGRQSLFAQFLLFRAHGMNAAAHGCSHILTAVRSNHKAFYQRFLGLESIADNSIYVDWFKADVHLLANETHACLAAILKRGMPDYTTEDVKQYIVAARLSIPQSYHLAA